MSLIESSDSSLRVEDFVRLFAHSQFMMAAASKSNSAKALQLIQQCAQRLRSNTSADYDRILSAVGDAKVVMIGEASHGII